MNSNELRQIQSEGAVDLLTTLRTVEINAVDICNRSCEFCPQSQGYKPKKGFFNLDLIRKISNDLNDINYNGRISFTGFGEPLLYKNLTEAMSIIKNTVTNLKWLEIVTNADYLDREKALELDSAGCTNVTVSMYDGDISSNILEYFDNTDIQLTFKHQYDGFMVVNRNEIVAKEQDLDITRSCYLPFYKMMIDIDGHVLVCANDWARSGIVGNVCNDSIKDIWIGEPLNFYRQQLENGKRKNCTPCKFCDIEGTIHGIDSVLAWNAHYKNKVS